MDKQLWTIDLAHNESDATASLTHVQGEDKAEAEYNALMAMRLPGQWRVVGIDRAKA